MASFYDDEERQASTRRRNFWKRNEQNFALLQDYHDRYLVREPIHDRDTSGWSLLLSMINGHHRRAYTEIRMNSEMVGKNEGNRSLQEFFGRGAATIHRAFHNVLKACNNMAKVWITPNIDNTRVHPYIAQNPRYSIFKDCIGAIFIGTHIKSCVPEIDLARYIRRKGYPTQNILAVCDFNMRFVFVMAGYEGISHDSRILRDCISEENIHFQMPPPGKYYLVDAGFANAMGFMAPYRRERYHLPDFNRQTSRVYRNKRECFNHRHSALRSVIERSFGVWKKRFHMVNDVPTNMKFKHQVRVVTATMSIHNWLRHVNAEDDGSQLNDYEGQYIDANATSGQDEYVNSADEYSMEDLRNELATRLWAEEDRQI